MTTPSLCGACPVPCNGMTDVPPLLERVVDPLLGPVLAGRNVATNVVEAPGARDSNDGAPTENPWSAPAVITGVESTSVAFPMFRTVTVNAPEPPSATTPKSSEAGDTKSTGAGLTIVTLKAARPRHPSAATARTVNVKVPPAVGRPATTPAALSDSPPGSVPAAMENEYGPVPPLAVM